MTFSFKVKNEICESIPLSYKKALSEIIGIIKFKSEFNFEDINNINFRILLDSSKIIDYVEKIFLKYFNDKYSLKLVKEVYLFKNSIYILKVFGGNIVEFLLDAGIIKFEKFKVVLNDNIRCSNINVKSFIKGIFIGCGSLSNPLKRYHLEFVIHSVDFAKFFNNFLNDSDLNSNILKRKGYYVVYIKEADKICEFLSIVGSNNGVLEFQDIRVNKEYSNNKNRLSNCIEANEDKLIIASVKQVRAIMYIDEKMGLKKLPKKLREIAELRLNNKEISIKDLGMLLNPPLGKSGVLHRFKKIEKIANELKFQ